MRFIAFESTTHARRSHDDIGPLIVPRIRNTVIMPMQVWRDKYEYFIECIWTCVRNYIEGSGVCISDEADLRRRLETYLFNTSINRFYKFDLLK
jgi:hypothetical protein